MNPLRRARYRTAATLRSARDGTTRTAGWIRDGVTGSAKKAGGAVTGLVRRDDGDDAKPDAAAVKASTAKTEPAAAADSEPGFFRGIFESARTDSRVGIAWILAGVLVFGWIGWAIYVTAENGANAGLGVVIAWPAVILALALVSAPFVGAYFLVRRLSAATPALAGGPAVDGATDTEQKGEKEENMEREKPEAEAEDSEDDSGEADSEEEEEESDGDSSDEDEKESEDDAA